MAHLRGVGVDVKTVVEIGLQGATDLAVVDAAAAARRAILTQDLDFGRIFVDRSPEVQIIVVRSATGECPRSFFGSSRSC